MNEELVKAYMDYIELVRNPQVSEQILDAALDELDVMWYKMSQEDKNEVWRQIKMLPPI